MTRSASENQRFFRNLITELGSVVSIVAADADDFRRLHGRQKGGVRQCNWIDAARSKAFHIAVSLFGRGQKDSDNRVLAAERFDQAILRDAIMLKTTIFHVSLSNHETWS